MVCDDQLMWFQSPLIALEQLDLAFTSIEPILM
jgi:hypothetical protein